MEFSKKERQRIRLEKLRKESLEAQQEHEADKILHKQISQESSSRKWIIAGVIGLILVIGIGAFSYMSSATPGRFDSFAKWGKFTTTKSGNGRGSFRILS